MRQYNLPVHLLRQYCFCPRIPYFLEVLDLPVTRPLWVRQGSLFHERQALLSKYRKLKRFGLDDAQMHFHPDLNSEEWRLHGVADLVLETVQHVYPVEFKTSFSSMSRGAIIQLIAYGEMSAEKWRKNFSKGFLLYADKGKVKEIHYNEAARHSLKKINGQVREILMTEQIPDSAASFSQCSQCEFLNYCNDRF